MLFLFVFFTFILHAPFNCSLLQIVLCFSSINDVTETSECVLEKYYLYKSLHTVIIFHEYKRRTIKEG